MAKEKSSAKKPRQKNDSVWHSVGRLIFSLVCLGIIAGCVMTCIFSVLIFNFIDGEPDIDLTNLEQSYTTILYADDPTTGEPYELTRVYATEENRIWVPVEKMPKHLLDATIAAEDERFFKHNGIDWKRTIAATLGHFIGQNKGGGSTIEQQLIKNVLNHTERTIPVKVQEIFGAVKLTKSYTKEQILEAYLNTIPFGNQTKGVQTAANLYFNKDVSDLTLAESCAIITLTNAPSAYSLYKEEGIKKNASRRGYILNNMLEQGSITQEEYDIAIEEEVRAVPKEEIPVNGPRRSWFEDYVIDEVCKDLAEKEGISEKEAMSKILNDGYRIYTTVDERAQ
ncbi:MAG: transglycosylase domain-containing protein, partial [Oscillospiraceae bacterium]